MANRTLSGVSGKIRAANVQPLMSGKAAPANSNAPAATGVTEEERRQRIAEAAYFMSEQRGFAPGYELDDWLQAEAEIDVRLRAATH